MEREVLISMRRMAWQRAKGELLSMLECYWQDTESHKLLKEKINDFIEDIEDNAF